MNDYTTKLIIDRYELDALLQEAAYRAVQIYVNTPKSDDVSERAAIRMYGGHLKEWVRCGHIKSVRTGRGENSKKIYSFKELSILAKRDGVKQRNLKSKI